MKNNLTLLVVTIGVAAFVSISQGQSFNARGTFNDWADFLALNDDGDGTYSLTIDQFSSGVSNMTAGTRHNFKIAQNDWASSWPGSDARTVVDGSGEINLHFQPGTINDGWTPTLDRVGYEDPGQFGWEIMGEFNGWNDAVDTAARQMMDMGSGLYSVDYTIATPGSYAFKFRESGSWDTSIGADFGNSAGDLNVTTTVSNETVTIKLDLPNGRHLVGDPIPAPTNNVTFVCDLEVPVSSGEFVTNFLELVVRGDFNGWATDAANFKLYQVGASTLYSNTVSIVAYQGTTINYKFYETQLPQEEVPLLSCGDTRQLVITGPNVSAPLAYWSDRQVSDPTNQIKFSVDMSLQDLIGNFDPSTDGVFARGGWNGFDLSNELTNNPAAANTNLYCGVADITAPLAACYKYKFFIDNTNAPNSGWESPISTGGNDREFTISSTYQELPVVFFNDQSICDVLTETNSLTFNINMTNAVGVDATVYDGTQDIYINGVLGTWWTWGAPPTEFKMTRVGVTSNYTITVAAPAGATVLQKWKFSIGGTDNEATVGNDHVRYVRTSLGSTTYSFPLDLWTSNDPTRVANLVEDELSLTANPGTPGTVQVDYMGVSCAELQSSTNAAGPWNKVSDAVGVSSTNVPAALSQEYFRMYRP